MEKTMSQIEAHACCRVLCAIERQIATAMREDRQADWRKMSSLFGQLEHEMFGFGCKYGADSPWSYVPRDEAVTA